MRRHRVLTAIVAGVCCFALAIPASASPYTHTTEELVTLSSRVSGEEVLFRGEAVGEALRSDDGHRFVNVLDGTVAVGVWMTEEQVALIDGWGRYGRTGTVLEVTGVLNVACEQHGGDFDVHATDVGVVEPATDRPVEGSGAKLIGAPLSLLAAGGMFAAYRWRRRRRWDP